MMKLILTDITTLPELKQFLEELPKDQHDYIDWSSLPTFGGDEPDDTTEVWSWDEENLLVGTCCSDWEIISRTAWTIAIDRVKYPGTMQDRSLVFVGSTNALGTVAMWEELFNEIKSNSFIEMSSMSVQIVPHGELYQVQLLTESGWINITDKPVCLNDAKSIRKQALTWRKQ